MGRTHAHYYVLVPPPARTKKPSKAPWRPFTNASAWPATALYFSTAASLKRDAADPLVPPTVVQDVVPGLQPVTEPSVGGTDKGGLEERNL